MVNLEKKGVTTMRKVTFGGANSLDNYFARVDDSVDWIMWSDEVAEIIKNYWANVDTILMGRKTFEAAKKQSGDQVENYVAGFTTYIFSRKLKGEVVKGANIISENAVEFVSELKNQPGKDICLMGGGNFAKTLLEADLIDEIGFNIHPVLLGSGIPIFYQMKKQINLKLIECKTFKNGCVYVLYEIEN